MSEADLIQAFTGLGQDVHVHMEAGESAPWVRGIILPPVKRVVISHPRSNARIANDPNKCDRIDAAKLADLLRMNRYTEVYYAPDTSRRDFKQLVQHYDDLTDQQVRLKNKIKARLRVQGIIVRDGRLFTRKGRTVVLEKVPSQDVRQAIFASLRCLGPDPGGTTGSPEADDRGGRVIPRDRSLQRCTGRRPGRSLPV
jgi:hypothetical protein